MPINAGEDGEKLDHSCTAVANVKWYSHAGNFGSFIKTKQKNPKTCNYYKIQNCAPRHSFQRTKDLCSIQKNCIQGFTAALFVIAKNPADVIPWNTTKQQKRKNY